MINLVGTAEKDIQALRGEAGVYRIVNVLDGTIYIGSAKDVRTRLETRRAKAC